MKTDDLVALLATDSRPVDTAALSRGTGLVALTGLLTTSGALVLMLGLRPDLATVLMTPPVLTKFALGGSVAGFALVAFQRSLRPGRASTGALALVLLPLAAVFVWALGTLGGRPDADWSGLVFGQTWGACVAFVTLYAMLPFAGLLMLAQHGAPVKPRLSGSAAGIGAAGLATMAYALHCPEDGLPFIAVWYPLAMAVAGGLGALAGPRLLRW